MKIGIIGNGFVGKATTLLACKDVTVIIYDINHKLCSPPNTSIRDICNCDIIFISVPTPMNKDGSCHLSIIKSVLRQINYIVRVRDKLVVIRSTVPPGTCDNLNCYFMPEFLTEKNYVNDFINNPNWIFGLRGKSLDTLFKTKITELFNLSHQNNKIKYNNINFTTNKEAEMIKLFRNTFLATKVSFCNEMYQFCQHKKINYENVRKIAVLDPRIGESHSSVPGHDGFFGYGGTCFPKDTNNLKHEIEKEGINSYIINGVVKRNEEIDRPEHDWKDDKGRAVI